MFAKLSHASLFPTLPIAARLLGHVAKSTAPLALFPESTRPQRSLGSYLLPSTAEQVKAGPLDAPALLIDLENVGPWGELSGVTEVDSIASNRLRFNQDNLITTRLRPYLQKTVLLQQDDALGSPEWISVRINTDALRPQLLFYILQSARFIELAPILSSGKEHPRISLDILNRLEIPALSLSEQDSILSTLEPLFKRANELLDGIDRIDTPLNEYFEDRFGLAGSLIDPATETKVIDVTLAQIAQSKDARFSFKYHSPGVAIAKQRLAAISSYRMRELLIEPAVLGDSVSPENYEAGTGFFYLSMVALKRWRVEMNGLNEVSEEYFDDHLVKHVQKGDVLMARSGEGTIGKVGLVDRDMKGVCADFVIRMRPDEKRLRPAFLHYCLMSRFYQSLIYGEKKGLGNNTNIFPNQIHEFPIIDLSPSEQDVMVRDLDGLVAKFDRDIAEANSLRVDINRRLISMLTA